MKALSAANGNQRWTTNLDEALAGPDAIFMDCAATGDATMVVQMDGTLGSAVAGRFRCFTQPAVNTPEAFFGGGRPTGVDIAAQWQEVPNTLPTANPFRQCWEAFLRHVSEDAPFGANLVEGAKAVQLADLAYRSVAEGRWMTVPEIRL